MLFMVNFAVWQSKCPGILINPSYIIAFFAGDLCKFSCAYAYPGELTPFQELESYRMNAFLRDFVADKNPTITTVLTASSKSRFFLSEHLCMVFEDLRLILHSSMGYESGGFGPLIFFFFITFLWLWRQESFLKQLIFIFYQGYLIFIVFW